MTYEERRPIYEAAIAHYGENCQIWKAIEEMAELAKEISSLQTKDSAYREDIVDEIADVTIMMEQLRLIFNANDDVQKRIDFKVRRLAQRIGA